MTQDEFKRYCALRRLRPIGRSGSRTTIPLDRSDLLSHMYGMSQVTTILWNTIAKAVLLFQAYSTGVGRLGGLHFAIQGPKGCGRRSAVMSVCRQCCCDMVTVSPLRHVSGDIEYAIMYAVENNPCVIYFDGMEDLHQLPDFDNEFTKQVLGSETLCNSWNAVWLGFGVETLRELDSKMYAMCGPRIAEVEPLKPEEAIKLLANEFLCMGGARVNPPLTVDERTILNEAVQGCTPADLRNFAATVHYRALSRMTLTALSEIYNVRIFDEFRARSHGDSQQARPHTEDNQCTDSCDIVRFLEISWDPDAVGAYDFVKPDAEYGDGKEHFFVPRAHRRQ